MLRSGAPLPSLAGAARWLHGEPDAASLQGRATLVHFWAISCPICKDNLPTLRRWKEEYGPRGLQFIAVHMPRQESDTRADAVEAAVRELGLDEPVAVDDAHALGERFETGGLWPVYYLFDAEGRLKSRAAGAAGLGMVEAALRRMLAAAA